MLLRSKTYCSMHCVCSPLQAALVSMYVNVHVHTCSYVLHYGYDRTERVNEEILPGRKPISMHNCKFISSCTIMYVCMYVCSYDLHYNVLWGRYASELKGLTKKLLFKEERCFHAKLRVHCCYGFECYFSITSSCIIITQYGSTVYIGMAMRCSAL